MELHEVLLGEMKHTERGFALKNFKDRNGNECSIQKSSSALEDCIWLGATELRVREFGPNGKQWRDVVFEDTMSHHFVGNQRMHLTRKQVKDLIPILQHFVDTGELDSFR